MRGWKAKTLLTADESEREMLKNGHLMRIRTIPHAISQTLLLYFLRRYAIDFRPVADGMCWFGKYWYEAGRDFIIESEPETVESWFDVQLCPFFGMGTMKTVHGLVIYPAILGAFIKKPMLLKLDMYNLSPADIDQRDINNSLRACQVLGTFSSGASRPFKRNQPRLFGIMVDSQRRLVLVSLDVIRDEGAPDQYQPLWYFPAEERSDFVW